MVITDAVVALDACRSRVHLLPVGELDAGSVDDLAEPVARALRDGAHEIDVDLASVTFMDTSALRVLEAAAEHLAASGGHLCLRNARPPVARLLQLAALVHGRPAG